MASPGPWGLVCLGGSLLGSLSLLPLLGRVSACLTCHSGEVWEGSCARSGAARLRPRVRGGIRPAARAADCREGRLRGRQEAGAWRGAISQSLAGIEGVYRAVAWLGEGLPAKEQDHRRNRPYDTSRHTALACAQDVERAYGAQKIERCLCSPWAGLNLGRYGS